MKTLQFQLNVGTVPGYGHDNQSSHTIHTVSVLWQQVAQETMESTGVYVSGVVQEARTVYAKAWGCPHGGENTLVITGLYQIALLGPDLLASWNESVKRVCREVARRLDQTTAYLTFAEVDFEYLTLKERT
jgi:hypothetical protein